ncbi:MAG: lytic transglycosylase domain-containing protein [Pyrinomonadaceae bacterium]
MKNVALFVSVFCLVAALPAFSQTRRTFDNFDTSRGVQIVTPTIVAPKPEPEEKPVKGKKKRVKKTSQTMSVEDGYGVKDSATYAKIIMASGKSLNGFSTGNSKVDGFIIDSCRRYNIDPLLIYSQMHQESGFKPKARSYKGASGLMQLMPATARRFGVTDIYDPKQNIDAGVKYMRWLLDTFNGDVVLALAGYNAGEGAVMKYGWQVPPYRETREYVRRIASRYSSIGNPTNLAKSVRKMSNEEAAKLETKEPTPLSIYEPNVMAVRLPDGSMRLVTQ